jgi:hypothetical protein
MALYIFVGLMVPIVLLFNAIVVPEPYSHPLINVAIAPTYLMPFLENKELLKDFTQIVFGRETPNFAPITIVILIFFWFIISMVAFYCLRFSLNKWKNT